MLGTNETGGTEALRVIACPHPLTSERAEMALPPGVSLAALLEIVQPEPLLRRHGHIFVGDTPVPLEYWGVVKPKAGQTVTIRMVPAGGGGGGKSPLRIVLSIAIIAASFYVGGAVEAWGLEQGWAAMGARVAGGLAAAGTPLLSSMVINCAEPLKP